MCVGCVRVCAAWEGVPDSHLYRNGAGLCNLC